MIWEQEGKSKRIVRSEDDKIMRDLDNGTTGHISRDSVWYTDRSHTSMWTRRSGRGAFVTHSQDGEKSVVIQEDQDGDLGPLQRSLYM